MMATACATAYEASLFSMIEMHPGPATVEDDSIDDSALDDNDPRVFHRYKGPLIPRLMFKVATIWSALTWSQLFGYLLVYSYAIMLIYLACLLMLPYTGLSTIFAFEHHSDNIPIVNQDFNK
jgi:hypothetical protein